MAGKRLAGEQAAAVPREGGFNERCRLEGAGRTGRSSGAGCGRGRGSFVFRRTAVPGERLAGHDKGNRGLAGARRRGGNSRRSIPALRRRPVATTPGSRVRFPGTPVATTPRSRVRFPGTPVAGGGLNVGRYGRFRGRFRIAFRGFSGFGLASRRAGRGTATATAAASTPALGAGFGGILLGAVRRFGEERGFRSGGAGFGFWLDDETATAGLAVGGGPFGTRLLLLIGLWSGALAAIVGPSLGAAVLAGILAVPVRGVGVVDLAGRLVAAAGRGFFELVGLFRVFEFEEVGYIEEGVAFEAHVHKGGLHAGQDAGDATVVNGPRQGVLVFAFVVDFRELIVFKDCKPRFMRRGGDADLFCHRTFPSGDVCLPGVRAVLQFRCRCQLCARRLFPEGKATQLRWFRGTSIGEPPCGKAGWSRGGPDGTGMGGRDDLRVAGVPVTARRPALKGGELRRMA